MATKVRISKTAQDKALETLTNMVRIVKHDKLKRGFYFWVPARLKRKGDSPTLCNGARACAIGSLLVAHRVELEHNPFTDDWDLPGTDAPMDFALGKKSNNPYSEWRDSAPDYGLALALTALNEVAQEWIDRDEKIRKSIQRRYAGGRRFLEAIERLFEGAYGTRGFGKPEMMRVINTAKRRVAAGKVEIRV